MSAAGFEPMTEAEVFAAAGTGAAKVITFRPGFVISQLSLREIVAMGLLLHALGLSTPDALPARQKKHHPETGEGR